jgi:hypothetical protein
LFEFLEVNDEHKEQVHYQEVIKEIPDNQCLTISDLKTLTPPENLLKCISKRILYKYSVIPLFTVLPGNKPTLPKHLEKKYWGSIDGKNRITLYVAMTEPFNLQVLNIIRSVTDYSVVSIPLNSKAANEFFKIEFDKITNSKSEPIKKQSDLQDIIITFKENLLYIAVFIIILIGLVTVKFYIEHV